MLRNRIKAAPPAAHAIRIERRSFRRHADDYHFCLGMNVDELTMDAERDQHAAIAIDPIPLAAIARLRKYFGQFRTCPGVRIAALIDIVDPRARHDLPAICDAAATDHFTEAGEVARGDADAPGGAHRTAAVDGDIGIAPPAERHPETFAEGV